MLHLTFLGTSAGMPSKHRNVSALAINCVDPYLSANKQQVSLKNPWVLIDCGEATQHQLLQTKLSPNQLVAICITHVHGDHCYGLPGLLASMAMLGRKNSLKLIAPKAIKKYLDAVMHYTDLNLPYAINFIVIEELIAAHQAPSISINFSQTHKLSIEIAQLSHRVPSYAFGLVQTNQTISLDIDKLDADRIMPKSLWGRLQKGDDVRMDNGKLIKSSDYTHRNIQVTNVVVAGDNNMPSLLTSLVKEADLLVHEATYTKKVADTIKARKDGFDPMHSSAQSIANFAEKAKLPNLILTHFSARYQPFDNPEAKVTNMADIRIEASQFYSGNLWLARDFAQFEAAPNLVKQLANNN